MTKSEMRKIRKDARESGKVVEFEDGRLELVTPRTQHEEAAHQRAMAKWARRYDELNGAPEGEWDR